ncbi:MAG TPA: shikimate dehydrogenase [Bacilli bacterium]
MSTEHVLPDSNTVMYGVFGDPVRHSKSPVMMNAAFREMGINAAYAAFQVAPAQLAAAVNAVRALKFGGVNVTIPHKVAIMNYLDEIDDSAQTAGAVNTVVNRDGRLIGFNTDGIGYVRSLLAETNAGLELHSKTILLIGAGGAARGVAFALAHERPKRIIIANRTREKAAQLAAEVGRIAPCDGIGLTDLADINRVDIAINTTSVGMSPHVDDLPADPALFCGPGSIVSDLVYNPLETKWLRAAKELGAVQHFGLGMFIYQGACALEHWTGRQAPVDTMRAAVVRSLA